MKPSAQRAIVTGVITLIAFAVPAGAAAQATSQTIQVLPPGGTGCPALPVQSITPHVVDGALHSFDVSVANASYVAVLAQVGGDSIPFNYMTRFYLGSGVIKHHVDLQTTPIRGSLPITLTLLSSPQGSPTCLTVISFSTSPTGAVLAPGATTGIMGAPATSPAPSSSGGGSSSGRGSSLGGSVSTGNSTGTSATSSSTTSVTSSPVNSGVGARLQGLCVGNNALQLWFLLLAMYVVIAAFTALAKPPLAQRSVALPLVLILVPLVLLLGLWYFVESCRAAGWVPAVSVIIAVAALLVAFRDQNPGVKIISLPAANSKDGAKSTMPAIAQKPAMPVVQNEQKPQQKGK